MPIGNYFVDTTCSKDFPRFILGKEARPNLFWSGSIWTEDKEQALIYADVDLALHDMQMFRVADFGLSQKQAFTIPLKVYVHSNTPVVFDQLQLWLKKALGFYADAKTHGDGPGDSLVIAMLDIGKLSEDVDLTNGLSE